MQRKQMNRAQLTDGDYSAGQTQPCVSAVQASMPDIYLNVYAVLEQYAMNSNLFIGDQLTGEVVTPANVALYLVGLFLSHLNQVGILGGSHKNDVCLDPAKLVIPTGFAKIMEHSGPFMETGMALKTAYSLDQELATTSDRFGWGTGENEWFDLSHLSDNPAYLYSQIRTNTAVGELVRVASGATFTLAQLWGGPAVQISQAIADAGYSCIRYSDIPRKAPNASAYALASVGGTPAVPSTLNAQWVSLSADFDSEEANLFHSFSVPSHAYSVSIVKPVIFSTVPCPGQVADRRLLSMKVNAWLGTRQKKYKPGAILKSYKLCALPVTTFCVGYQVVDPGTVFNIAYTAFNHALRQMTIKLSELEMLRLLYLYFHSLVTLLTSRVNQGSFHHNLYATVTGFWNPQAGYVSKAWLSTPLPPFLARMIDSVGPVNIKGTLIVPFLITDPTESGTLTFGPIRHALALGDVHMSGGPYWGYDGLGAQPVITQAEYSFVPEQAVLTSALLTAYFDPTKLAERNLFWNCNSGYFTAMWDLYHKKGFAGSTLSSSLVHAHNPECGTLSAMATAVDRPGVFDKQQVPDATLGFTLVLNYISSEAIRICSYVDLTPDEIVEAATFRIGLTAADGLPHAKFNFTIPSTGTSTQLTQSIMVNTFSPESAYSKALSAREAKFDPVVARVAGVPVTSITEGAGCFIDDLTRNVFSTAFNALKIGGPAALGVVCNSQLPGTAGICSSGAQAVIRTLESLAGVEAHNHTPVKPAELAPFRAAIRPPVRPPAPSAVRAPIRPSTRLPAKRRRQPRQPAKRA